MTFYRQKAFPLIAACLYLAFLTLDLTGLGDSTWVKYAAVCLCCLTALLGARTADGKLVALALCFTVGADWFLLVRNDHYAVGIGLFIVVQLLYSCRLWLLREKHICSHGLILRILCGLFSGLLLLGLFFLFLWWREGPPMATLGQALRSPFSAWLPLFCFANLAVNTGEAFALGKTRRGFALGLLLFVLCDLCVGAYNQGIFTSFTWWASWLFYLPSQVLIALSQEPEKGDPDEKRF